MFTNPIIILFGGDYFESYCHHFAKLMPLCNLLNQRKEQLETISYFSDIIYILKFKYKKKRMR